MLPNFCNGFREANQQVVLNVMDILSGLKATGKFDTFDPANPKSANDFKIKVSAVCCAPFAGYMDSKVEVKNYTIGFEIQKDA